GVGSRKGIVLLQFLAVKQPVLGIIKPLAVHIGRRIERLSVAVHVLVKIEDVGGVDFAVVIQVAQSEPIGVREAERRELAFGQSLNAVVSVGPIAYDRRDVVSVVEVVKAIGKRRLIDLASAPAHISRAADGVGTGIHHAQDLGVGDRRREIQINVFAGGGTV